METQPDDLFAASNSRTSFLTLDKPIGKSKRRKGKKSDERRSNELSTPPPPQRNITNLQKRRAKNATSPYSKPPDSPSSPFLSRSSTNSKPFLAMPSNWKSSNNDGASTTVSKSSEEDEPLNNDDGVVSQITMITQASAEPLTCSSLNTLMDVKWAEICRVIMRCCNDRLLLFLNPNNISIRKEMWCELCSCRECTPNRVVYSRRCNARPPFMPLLDYIVNGGDDISRRSLGKGPHCDVLDSFKLRVTREMIPKNENDDKVKAAAYAMVGSGRDICLPSFNIYGALPKVYTEIPVNKPKKNANIRRNLDSIMSRRDRVKIVSGKDKLFRDYVNPLKGLVLMASPYDFDNTTNRFKDKLSEPRSNTIKDSDDDTDDDDGDGSDDDDEYPFKLTYYLVPARYLFGEYGSWSDKCKYRRRTQNIQWLNYSRFDNYSSMDSQTMLEDKILFTKAKETFCNENGTPSSFMKWLNGPVDIFSDLSTDDELYQRLMGCEPIIINPQYKEESDVDTHSSEPTAPVWKIDSLMDFIDKPDAEKELGEANDNYNNPRISRSGYDRHIKSFYSHVYPDMRYMSNHRCSVFKKICEKGYFDNLESKDMPRLIINDDVRRGVVETIHKIRRLDRDQRSSSSRCLYRCFFTIPIDGWMIKNRSTIFDKIWLNNYEEQIDVDGETSPQNNKTSKKKQNTDKRARKHADKSYTLKRKRTKKVDGASKRRKVSQGYVGDKSTMNGMRETKKLLNNIELDMENIHSKLDMILQEIGKSKTRK